MPHKNLAAPAWPAGDGRNDERSYAASHAPRESYVQELVTLAVLKEQLLDEIAWTQLVFLYADCEIDIEALAYKVAAFVKACKVLAWRGLA